MAPKLGSQVMPTIEEVVEWSEDALFEWILQNQPELVKGDRAEKFKEAAISGDVFVDHADDVDFFEKRCRLPPGVSDRLAKLASKLGGRETLSSTTTQAMKRKASPYPNIAPLPKRTRVGKSSLVINGELKTFRPGPRSFSKILRREGQAYFDRTSYILTLNDVDEFILFCRPRRFGKSLTVSMLHHFHGLEYAREHESIYQGLDVQKDIEQKKVIPGQFFVLKFDFSKVKRSSDLTTAQNSFVRVLNASIVRFYEIYATFLGESFDTLRQHINSEAPEASLEKCAYLVQDAIKADEKFPSKGMYVLIDEYDAFPNYYLDLLQTSGVPKISWDGTTVETSFRNFWDTVKALSQDGAIERIFVTGIAPLSLSSLGSSFNVLSNVSFHTALSGLCGLTSKDLGDALGKFVENSDNVDFLLTEMVEYFNGYHFCNSARVETVFNTETCLAYLQSAAQKQQTDEEDPENSEVSEQFLRALASSALVIADFEKATKLDERGQHVPLDYLNFKKQLTLRDLNAPDNHAAWTSLIVYFGGLTFHPEKPKSWLKIPNLVAHTRIARAVLEQYDLCSSWTGAIQRLVDDGNIEKALRVYRSWIVQRDVTDDDLSKKNEATHRDDFSFRLQEHPLLKPNPEFQVIKKSNTDGRVDLVLRVKKWLVVTEWKFYRIPFLDVPVGSRKNASNLAKAATLYNYDLAQILQLGWNEKEKFKGGTIRSWTVHETAQLKEYVTGPTVEQLLKECNLELRAHLVIIVGSRHILLMDMDKMGNPASEPRLVEMPN